MHSFRGVDYARVCASLPEHRTLVAAVLPGTGDMCARLCARLLTVLFLTTRQRNRLALAPEARWPWMLGIQYDINTRYLAGSSLLVTAHTRLPPKRLRAHMSYVCVAVCPPRMKPSSLRALPLLPSRAISQSRSFAKFKIAKLISRVYLGRSMVQRQTSGACAQPRITRAHMAPP